MHMSVPRKQFVFFNVTESQNMAWNLPVHFIGILFNWFIYIKMNLFTFINHILNKYLLVRKIPPPIRLLDHIWNCQKNKWTDIWLVAQPMASVPFSTKGHLVGKYPIIWHLLVGSIPVLPSPWMPSNSKWIVVVYMMALRGCTIRLVVAKFINLPAVEILIL